MKANIFWWEPPKDSLPIQFCDSTSLHGLRYIGQSKRNMVERIFWLLAFLTSISVACVLINGIWHKYRTNPVITTFDGVPTVVYQVPFPAITICNVNSIEKSKAMKIIQEGYTGDLVALAKISLLNHICSAEQLSFSQKFGFVSNGSKLPDDLLAKLNVEQGGVLDGEEALNITIQEFLHANSQSCEDMLLLCLWQDKIYNCSELFQPIETDFGKCCTFNMVPRSLLYTYQNYRHDSQETIKAWQESKISNDIQWMPVDELVVDVERPDRRFPLRASHAGQSRGLSVLLNPGLDEYFCSAADYDGLRISAHQSLAAPDVANLGVSIASNRETFVNIRPEIVRAEHSLRGIDISTRKCYFDGEFQLGYFKYYTESNCLDECRSNLTYKQCNCVNYFMPRDPLTQDLCGIRSFECAKTVAQKLTMNGHQLKEHCDFCLPTCNEINYVTEIYDAPIRHLNIWLKAANDSGGGLVDNVDTTKWYSMKVTITHFYFGDDSTFPKLRKELFGFVDMLASTGGILGLCLGFSALSLLEILYFVTIRLICTFARKRRHTDAENPDQITDLAEQFRKDCRDETRVKAVKIFQPTAISKKISHPILYPNLFMREILPAALRNQAWATMYHEN